jgi:hypothetical protein
MDPGCGANAGVFNLGLELGVAEKKICTKSNGQ